LAERILQPSHLDLAENCRLLDFVAVSVGIDKNEIYAAVTIGEVGAISLFGSVERVRPVALENPE